jgi:hypothetical protein
MIPMGRERKKKGFQGFDLQGSGTVMCQYYTTQHHNWAMIRDIGMGNGQGVGL